MKKIIKCPLILAAIFFTLPVFAQTAADKTHEHTGEFADDKHFTMIHKAIHDGKEYIETITLTLIGTDKLDFKLTVALNGKKEEKITGTFLHKTMKRTE